MQFDLCHGAGAPGLLLLTPTLKENKTGYSVTAEKGLDAIVAQLVRLREQYPTPPTWGVFSCWAGGSQLKQTEPWKHVEASREACG